MAKPTHQAAINPIKLHPQKVRIYFLRCECQEEKNYGDPKSTSLQELLDNQAYPICEDCGAELHHSFTMLEEK